MRLTDDDRYFVATSLFSNMIPHSVCSVHIEENKTRQTKLETNTLNVSRPALKHDPAVRAVPFSRRLYNTCTVGDPKAWHTYDLMCEIRAYVKENVINTRGASRTNMLRAWSSEFVFFVGQTPDPTIILDINNRFSRTAETSGGGRYDCGDFLPVAPTKFIFLS